MRQEEIEKLADQYAARVSVSRRLIGEIYIEKNEFHTVTGAVRASYLDGYLAARKSEVNNYQELASRTLLDEPEVMPTPQEMMLVWNAIGLAGEVGEVCEIIKKVIFHRHVLTDEMREKLIKELGDVSWYHSAILTKIKATLQYCLAKNIAKLEARYPNGFKSEDSISRKE